MLSVSYLAQKLRTQSLNELPAKPDDDDHDSGTESDDESADIQELQKYMEANHDGAATPSSRNLGRRHHSGRRSVTSEDEDEMAPSKLSLGDSPAPVALDSALPSDSDHNYDHHSSEEELEVINRVVVNRGATSSVAEKRKWSSSHHENSSSDEELRDLPSAPVQFCSSPPANVHRPTYASPPPKVFHAAALPPLELCSVSPRKRHRRTPTAASNHSSSSSSSSSASSGGASIQRPCLDFEKMQQIRVRLL